MKKILSVLVIVFMLVSIGCSKGAVTEQKKPLKLENERQKAGYSIGHNIGLNIKNIADDIDMDALYQGIQDAAFAKKVQLTKEEMETVLKDFSQKVNQKMMEKRKIDSQKNKTEGDAFLAANAQKPGVKVTASGLQYLVVEEGKGPKPKATDVVKVDYRGTLIDGKEFDSSYARKQPATFPLNQVIPGWTEGVQLMSVGSTYKFFIPAALGYGDRGAGDQIPAGATLVFEVKLISIESQPGNPAQPKK